MIRLKCLQALGVCDDVAELIENDEFDVKLESVDERFDKRLKSEVMCVVERYKEEIARYGDYLSEDQN